MNCPSCQTPAADNQPFCMACGGALREVGAQAGAAPKDSLLGSVLVGKYPIVRLIGEGGMGAVYEGEQKLGTKVRRVAIKTLHKYLSQNENIRARFVREVGTVAELEHPNTIHVYDFGVAGENLLYIVMEFIQGDSLAQALAAGPMTPERTAKILSQVAGSLEEAHRRGIVHRDLQPDNVVLTERAGQKDFVKVLDFGIAKRSTDDTREEAKLTKQGMVLGTPPYMSPEQFTSRPIDARSDVYSLGVMAYEMLTGTLPFTATTAWEWATQHMTAAPTPIESAPNGARVPAAMREAIRRALEKEPAARPASMKDFMDVFNGVAPAAVAPRPGSTLIGDPPAQKGRTELGAPSPILGYAPGPPPAGTEPGMAPPTAPSGLAPAITAAGYTPSAHTPPLPPYAYTPSPGPAAPAYGTLSAGNHAFPTPVGIPQPPNAQPGYSTSHGEEGGWGRGPLLAIAAIVGVLSIGAIVYAAMPRSKATVTPPTVPADTATMPQPPPNPPPTAPTAALTLPTTRPQPPLTNTPPTAPTAPPSAPPTQRDAGKTPPPPTAPTTPPTAPPTIPTFLPTAPTVPTTPPTAPTSPPTTPTSPPTAPTTPPTIPTLRPPGPPTAPTAPPKLLDPATTAACNGAAIARARGLKQQERDLAQKCFAGGGTY